MRFHVAMKLVQLPLLLAGLVLPFTTMLTAASQNTKDDYLVYIGTYTGKGGEGSRGIYVYRFDSSSGKLTPAGLAAEIPSPSFLAIHPNQRYLYSVRESGKEGSVSAFEIDKSTGRLKLLNTVSSKGGGPCHLVVDKTGRNVLVVNYGSGSTAVLPVKQDGSLEEASSFIQHSGTGADPRRQKGPHAHSVNLDANNRYAIVADLGLDHVLVYRFDPKKGLIEPNDPPYAAVAPGAGPRHFAFHPKSRFGYVINEMGNTVTAFSWDGRKGKLTEIQTITTLPKGFSGTSYTAEVQVHPNGKFLYGSNRGHDSIAVFSIDPAKGTLSAIEYVPTQGKFPRNFGIDPAGSYLIAANQDSNNLVVFRIDGKTGKLTPTGQVEELGRPVCVKFLPLK